MHLYAVSKRGKKSNPQGVLKDGYYLPFLNAEIGSRSVQRWVFTSCSWGNSQALAGGTVSAQVIEAKHNI